MFGLSTRQIGNVTVMDASGKISLGRNTAVIRDTIRDLAAAGHKRILFNLSDVNEVDGSVRGVLWGEGVLCRTKGVEFKLLRPSESVRRNLGIAGINPWPIVQVFDDESAAVRSFSGY